MNNLGLLEFTEWEPWCSRRATRSRENVELTFQGS